MISILFLMIHVAVIYQGYSDDNSSPEDRRELTRESTSLVRLFIGACIWVSYIWFSERSKHTFANETGEEEEGNPFHQQF